MANVRPLGLVARIRRWLVSQIPGTAANIARGKARMERALRADGWSRSAALAETVRRFKGHDV